MISLAANDLREAAGLIRRLKQRTTLPILDQLLVSVQGPHAFLAVTDLSVGIVIRLDIAGPSVDCRFCLPRTELLNLAKFADKGSSVRLVPGTGRSSIGFVTKKLPSTREYTALDPAEFPDFPDPADNACILPTATLDAIRLARRCSSPDPTREVLCGVCLDPRDGGAVVATDGRRMLMTPARVPFDESIVPNPVADLLVDPACEGAAVWHAEGNRDEVPVQASLTFGAGRVRISFQLAFGRFPNYRQVIPAVEARTASYTFTPGTSTALATWLRAYPMDVAELRPDGPYTVSVTRCTDKGESKSATTVPAAIAGTPPDLIAFPSGQLADLFDMGLLTLDIVDAHTPAVGTNGTTRCIISPSRRG